jgi:Protein of unknown function (DUF3072)
MNARRRRGKCFLADEAREMSDDRESGPEGSSRVDDRGEPMTAAQESYLSTLAHEAGEDVPGNLTKAQASRLIDKLQGRSGRLKAADPSGPGRHRA